MESMEECYALKQPSMEEQLQALRNELKGIREHCGKIEQENTVLQRLYNRQYSISQDYANAMKE